MWTIASKKCLWSCTINPFSEPFSFYVIYSLLARRDSLLAGQSQTWLLSHSHFEKCELWNECFPGAFQEQCNLVARWYRTRTQDSWLVALTLPSVPSDKWVGCSLFICSMGITTPALLVVSGCHLHDMRWSWRVKSFANVSWQWCCPALKFCHQGPWSSSVFLREASFF